MAGTIKVNHEAATAAASGFGNEADAMAEAMSQLQQMEDSLADWQGDAATAAKATNAVAVTLGQEAGHGLSSIGELIVNAQQTFSAADDSAAAKM